MSLSELARLAGVSKATLSGLERGAGNPSIDTVWSLAQALNVPFGELFDDDGADVAALTRLADARVVTDEDGFVGRRLLRRDRRGGLELYVLDLVPGTRREAAPHSPGVVEHVIGIAGRACVGPVGEESIVGEGDCLTFPADRAHSYEAVGGAVRLLSITDYP